MTTLNKLDLERDHFENALLHDLKAAVIIFKRHGLEDEFYAERQKMLDAQVLDQAATLPAVPRTES
jgi:hypothetical protein